MSEGLRQPHWKPATGSLMSQTLPFSVTPFEPHKADMIFIPGLNNPGGGGGHSSYGCVYYGLGSTGGGYKEPTGKTIDQVVAGGPAQDGQRAHARCTCTSSWSARRARPPRRAAAAASGPAPGQPINPVGDPYAVYREIFAGGDTNPNANPAEIKRLMAQKKSVLDYVGGTLEDFQQPSRHRGPQTPSAPTTSRCASWSCSCSRRPAADGKCGGEPGGMINLDDGASYPLILKAHLNLMVAALKCGITHVATLQTGDSSGNNINFAFVPGIPARSRTTTRAPSATGTTWATARSWTASTTSGSSTSGSWSSWAELFAQMKAVPEAGGSLFDNTIILIGNHMEEGANHNSNAIPWMLAGGRSMNYLNLGNCVSGTGNRVASVMAGIVGAMGIPGPYGAPLNGLKA